MQITVSGKQVELSDALRTRVAEQLDLITGKYFDARAGSERHLQPRPQLLHLRHQRPCRPRPHAARRGRGGGRAQRVRRRGRAHRQAAATLPPPGQRARARPGQPRPPGGRPPIRAARRGGARSRRRLTARAARQTFATVIAESPAEINVLSVGEAVMRLDLADQQVLMFRNSASNELNVIYRRPDGNIGWIDPSAGGQVARPTLRPHRERVRVEVERPRVHDAARQPGRRRDQRRRVLDAVRRQRPAQLSVQILRVRRLGRRRAEQERDLAARRAAPRSARPTPAAPPRRTSSNRLVSSRATAAGRSPNTASRSASVSASRCGASCQISVADKPGPLRRAQPGERRPPRGLLRAAGSPGTGTAAAAGRTASAPATPRSGPGMPDTGSPSAIAARTSR